jgi:UDP-N-acetylmuramate-alanine ligase
MEVRGVVNGITVYDDFAHHPTAFAATIAGCAAHSATRASWRCSSRAPTP